MTSDPDLEQELLAAESEEALKARLEREYNELLQELRSLIPGANVLLGFLLAVSFTDAFGKLDRDERYVYFATLVSTATAIVLFMARMGLITARFLWRNFKYAILIIFIAAAILTPDASPVTQTAMAAPMILLYLLSILLAWLFGKKREPIDEETPA